MRTAVPNPSFAPSMKASYTFIFALIPATMNNIITEKSMMFASDVDTTSICTCDNCIIPHVPPAISAHIPKRKSNMARLKRFMRWYMLVTISPTSVDTVVASRIGMNTSVGFAAPISAR